jgi:hypothetical protein
MGVLSTDGEATATERPDDKARVLSLHGEGGVRAELARVTIKSLDDCVLGFDLGPQASHGDAVAIADFLNQNILAITLT